MKWRINGSEIIEATSLAEAVYIASAMVEVEPLTSIERIPDEPVLANFNPNMHYDRYCLPGKAKRFDVCVTTRYCGEYRDGWRWVCEIQGCDGVKRHQYLYVGTNQETPDRDPIKPPHKPSFQEWHQGRGYKGFDHKVELADVIQWIEDTR